MKAARNQAASARHRLILVREQDAQHSGSGCCGRLGEAHTRLGRAADYGHSRARMEQMGVIYRALAQRLPELDLMVADPRNWIALYPQVWRAARAQGLGIGATLKSLARAGSPAAVVLDGETLFFGRLPGPEAVIDTVLERLADRGGAK